MRLDWFAIRVKSNREQVTAMALEGKGYDVFLPRYHPRGGVKETILFLGYLFCKLDITGRLQVLMLPGVVRILGFGKVPVPVDESELESVRLVVNAGMSLELEPTFQPGRKVRIERGPLTGVEGSVVGVQKQRLIISVTLLQRSISVEAESDWIRGQEALPLVRRIGSGWGGGD